MKFLNRRHFLRISIAGIAPLILPFKNFRLFSSINVPKRKIIPFDKMKVLSAKEFYVQSIDEKPPKIESKKWRLSLDGLFKNPMTLNYDQIMARESVTQMTSLACIGNEVGGQQIGNARWTGFRLRGLLEEAGLGENAKKIIFYCEDIYSTAIEIQSLLNDNVMLAYVMNEKPLTREHGFPLRLIIPGRYGMKNPKWLRKLVATEEDYRGYWENFGWSDTAELQIITRIDRKVENHIVQGVALNGKNKIDKIDVSLDGGQSWNEANIEQTESSYVWSLWSFEIGVTKGKIEVVCRATNEQGETQDETKRLAFPSGASAPDRQKFRIL
ncbi:molybdopterin-dependent oxidoreductase [bacterium]|nr:MAG: molybdopterin-dependent oxidoreductase [bacterium]